MKGRYTMKLFECIVDDGERVFKTTIASKNKKELLSVYGGNGAFEKITDVTKVHNTISVDMLTDTLRKAQYGEGEIALITALLEEHNKQFQ